MTWILGQIIAMGIPEKYAKFAAIGFAITALGIAAFVFKINYDHSVIQKHDAKIAQKVEAKTAKVDAQSNTERAADTAHQTSENNSLGKVIDNAPKPTVPASTARQRYYECLRLWQSKHPSGGSAPAC